MDIRPSFVSLDNPNDILELKNILSRLAYDLDIIFTTSDPSGVISARQGTRALVLDGATYKIYTNTDGSTAWQKNPNEGDVVLLTGDQTIAGIKTFSSIPILPASDPTTDHQAARKLYVDGKFNTTTGHDHDNSDSKKVLATNLDATGVASGYFLKESSGGVVGAQADTEVPFGATSIFSVYLGSALNIVWNGGASATLSQKLLLNTENFDVGADWDTTNTKYVAPVAGKYMFTVSMGVTSYVQVDGFYIDIYVNTASTAYMGMAYMTVSGTQGRINGSIIMDLAANDVVEFYVNALYKNQYTATVENSAKDVICGKLLYQTP